METNLKIEILVCFISSFIQQLVSSLGCNFSRWYAYVRIERKRSSYLQQLVGTFRLLVVVYSSSYAAARFGVWYAVLIGSYNWRCFSGFNGKVWKTGRFLWRKS